jgi:class 3 adenylate cyclase
MIEDQPKRSIQRFLYSIPLRLKIIIPYLVIASLLAGLATYQVGRSYAGSLEQRFRSQLEDAAIRAGEGLIDLEESHLQVIRTIAFTMGVPEAVVDQDIDLLQSLIFPHVVNNQLAYVDILDSQGAPLVSWHRSEGTVGYKEDETTSYQDWPVVESVLSGQTDEYGDKYIAIVDAPWGQVLYTVGPIRTEDELLGVVLVGTPLSSVISEIGASSIADVTLYNPTGEKQVSTLNISRLSNLDGNITYRLSEITDVLPTREITIGNREYVEVVDELTLRGETTDWYLGISLPKSLIQQAQGPPIFQLMAVFGFGVLALIGLGVIVAEIISMPIFRLVEASREVGSGNLDVQVEVQADDEIGLLAKGFNNMVAELRQREFIREMFGRMVSEDVSEAVIRGDVPLGGDACEVSVLFTDVRGFTSLAEKIAPQDVISLLNHYFSIITKATRNYQGVINHFGGDSVLAVFGAPIVRPIEVTLNQAIHAALEIQRGVVQLNAQRVENGLLPLRYGVGVNSGLVIAGNIGTEDRFEYTVIGDVVNVAARLQGISRQFPHTPILIPASSVDPIASELDLEFQYLGDFRVRGKVEPIPTYAILGLRKSIPPDLIIFDRFPYPKTLALMGCFLYVQGYSIPTVAQTLQVGEETVDGWLTAASENTAIISQILMDDFDVEIEQLEKLTLEFVE